MSTKKIVLASIAGLIGGVSAIYFLWASFIPMIIGDKIVERKVLEQSPQYVITQKSAIYKLYPQYLQAEGGVKIAIKSQMCEIANNIPQSEWPNEIINICK